MVDPKSDFERHEGWRETLEFIEPRVKKFLFSLNRVGYLTHLASVHLIPAKSREEILRSVVVLTHATLEDFLRTIGRAEILRNPRPDFLSKVSLASNGQSLQKEKFTLNELMVHRAKTVQEVLDDSVMLIFKSYHFQRRPRSQ